MHFSERFNRTWFVCISLLLFGIQNLHAQAVPDTIPEILVYKKIDTLRLELRVFRPAGFDHKEKYPAIIFFFGGGWINGNITQFQK
nr:hypothetical protein [uncultured Dyadobacter sp.]